MSAQREFDLISQAWFQTKIARHDKFNYHFITAILKFQDSVSANI